MGQLSDLGAKLLQDTGADLVGLQEPFPNQVKFILEAVPEKPSSGFADDLRGRFQYRSAARRLQKTDEQWVGGRLSGLRSESTISFSKPSDQGPNRGVGSSRQTQSGRSQTISQSRRHLL